MDFQLSFGYLQQKVKQQLQNSPAYDKYTGSGGASDPRASKARKGNTGAATSTTTQVSKRGADLTRFFSKKKINLTPKAATKTAESQTQTVTKTKQKKRKVASAYRYVYRTNYHWARNYQRPHRDYYSRPFGGFRKFHRVRNFYYS